jgi:Protein of unknown function (DUF2587)
MDPNVSDNNAEQAIMPTPTETVDVSKPAKLMRLGAMTRQMLEELRLAPLDEQGRKLMREIYQRSINEVKDILSPELQDELNDLAAPFSEQVPSESELRIAQAQLMGWLEGLFHGIQAALWAQQAMAQQQAAQFPRAAMPGGQPQDKPSGYL